MRKQQAVVAQIFWRLSWRGRYLEQAATSSTSTPGTRQNTAFSAGIDLEVVSACLPVNFDRCDTSTNWQIGEISYI